MDSMHLKMKIQYRNGEILILGLSRLSTKAQKTNLSITDRASITQSVALVGRVYSLDVDFD